MIKTHEYRFAKAIPVWKKGKEGVMNYTLSFRSDIEYDGVSEITLALAASTSFVVRVNGRFVAHGPARCAHGFFRVDEYDIKKYLRNGRNIVAIRVVGYNINSYSYTDQSSFLCAEIIKNQENAENEIIAATGVYGFSAYNTVERLIKAPKYSFQRPMAECYTLEKDAFCAETEYETSRNPIELSAVSAKNFIYRDIPYGDLEDILPSVLFRRGEVKYSDKKEYYNPREITQISPVQLGYTADELECKPHVMYGRIDHQPPEYKDENADDFFLEGNSYADIDMGFDATGIIELDIESEQDGVLYISFDEILIGEEMTLNPFRLGVMNAIPVTFKKGKYTLLCAEPYVMKYLRFTTQDASVRISNFRLHRISFPKSQIAVKYNGNDSELEVIYNAAVETFCANTVDIYMDCPSRERAGWLCDSFWTSRVENVLSGKALVERAFLENFLIPESFKALPHGMLPMCYPADHYDGVFIPNWAMWYVLELREYLDRTSDREFIDFAKDRVMALLGYFEKFENEVGLLERLDSWIFIDWSRANDLTQDVSYGTNMLYTLFLDAIAYMYGDNSLLEKATNIRKTINEMSLTESGFYCDNAVRVDGKLKNSGECTEALQYYAFFCNVATPEKNKWLWDTLLNDFSYERHNTGKYPEIGFANAFIGNYIRLELICRYGYYDVLKDNIKGYFSYMAKRTGTLWELVSDNASCNHGFASHVIYWMDKMGYISHE